jgi:pSer/pThr/pTyr-binding forkhead associated (FHA) protein
MKVILLVAEGPLRGKTIPVSRPEFYIGRDPQCQLRPASPMISRRHCVLLLRDGRCFVRDFGSTNGTLINDVRVQGERELQNGNRLRIDPLEFVVQIETGVTVDQRTPLPPLKPAAPMDDEAIAEILLDLHDENDPRLHRTSDVIPGGTTIIQPAAPPPDAEPVTAEKKAAAKPGIPKGDENTSSAAQAILDKYRRRKKN